MKLLGWIVWGLACAAVLGLLAEALRGREKPRVAISFSIWASVGLALTAFTAFSKFHLLWMLPAAAALASGKIGEWLADRRIEAQLNAERRAAAKVPPLDLSPFGTLRWTEYDCWEGRTCLPAWAGFQSRGGVYASKDSDAASDGSAVLTVRPHAPTIDRNPSEAQRRALEFQVKNGGEVARSVLIALLPYYREFKQSCGLDDELMPPISSPDEFRKMIGLSQVHVHPYFRDGLGYIGLEFGCDWDEEHGLGIMMHGSRVVDIGSADTSFDQKPDEAQLPQT